YGLSVSVSDFNRDGYPDVYVGNDFVQPDLLYINNHDGTFSNHLGDYFRHTSQSTMGTELSDFDNDGLVDLFAVDMLPTTNYRQKTLQTVNTLARYTSMVQNGYFEPVVRNVLQHNNGNGTFSDLACFGGVYKTDWSWSGLLADLDNDGLKDIHVANGYRRDVSNFDFVQFFSNEVATKSSNELQAKYKDVKGILEQVPSFKVRNFVFQNQGNFQFADKGGDWMTMPGSWSCGSAWADLDADGDLDLIVSNLEDPAFIYKNQTRDQGTGNYLQVKLQGSAQNPFAVGASALIEYAGQRQFLELNPTHGIFSSVEHLLHFGLGSSSQVDKLTVRWPDGKVQILASIPANQRLTLKYVDAAGLVPTLMPPATLSPLLQDETARSGVNFRHQENATNDFEKWPLNPWSETDLGPLLAKGDVNGDGLEDFFIGNATGSPSGLFIQTFDGRFRAASLAAWEKNKRYEAHGAAFFDADGDGDQDLYVVSGGAEAGNDAAWQNNLYLNDGKGDFSLLPSALPVTKDVGLRVAPFDYDGDGDLDVFVGGRVSPGKWPLTPRSFVLRNNRSAGQTGTASFTEVTNLVAGDFERCGMVTDLAWADLDGDQKPELIAVGEWMPVTIFQWNNGKLQNVTAKFGLDKSNGLWFRLALADLDGDGDLDLITGNLGLNTRFTASPDAPLRCFAKDFDNNGTIDPLLTYFSGGKSYPLVPRDVLVKHIPSLKKKFLYANNYGEATIDLVYPQNVLDGALNLSCYTLETCWWENKNGQFIQHHLPLQAQLSPMQGIVADDVNGDGHPDLLLAGNKYGMDVETNRCDAGNGALLLGDGKGGFVWDSNLSSGFWATWEARDLLLLDGPGTKKIYV
ncbi:MAG: VCBS repeat-containing protein, partial [Saprospiraceae bacterium]